MASLCSFLTSNVVSRTHGINHREPSSRQREIVSVEAGGNSALSNFSLSSQFNLLAPSYPSVDYLSTTMIGRSYLQTRTMSTASVEAETTEGDLVTLTSFFSNRARLPDGDSDLLILLTQIQSAVKVMAALIARAGMEGLMGPYDSQPGTTGRDKQKKLDVVTNDIFKDFLRRSKRVAVMASEEDDGPILVPGVESGFTVVFDPLDGSRNIEASIPTGTIFGIYGQSNEVSRSLDTNEASARVLVAGSNQVAAGYALYSSATILMLSVGSGTHGFTLDPSIGEFILTHPDVSIPARGQIYSVNDARYFDWPKGLQRYIDDIRQGKGQNPKQYSARYICSLVADFHRTLLYGGIAMNPRNHLRLVYEANPLSFLCEQAGGRGSDGKQRILDIQPTEVHQRLPLFLGSSDDIAELESYGDVQQVKNPGYTV